MTKGKKDNVLETHFISKWEMTISLLCLNRSGVHVGCNCRVVSDVFVLINLVKSCLSKYIAFMHFRNIFIGRDRLLKHNFDPINQCHDGSVCQTTANAAENVKPSTLTLNWYTILEIVMLSFTIDLPLLSIIQKCMRKKCHPLKNIIF